MIRILRTQYEKKYGLINDGENRGVSKGFYSRFVHSSSNFKLKTIIGEYCGSDDVTLCVSWGISIG